jgi:type II secretory pathway pseudopilin PulG
VRRRRSAYTLFELVLVLVILIILAALIYPSFDAMYGGYRLTGAADMVRAAWASARARALEEGRPYRFAVVPGKGNYRIAPDSADFWAGNNSTPDANGADNPPLVVEDALPKGVRFATVEALRNNGLDQGSDSVLPQGSIDSSVWNPVATFLPDGNAREDVEIAFHGRGGRPLILRLRGLTGVVTVKTFEAEGR